MRPIERVFKGRAVGMLNIELLVHGVGLHVQLFGYEVFVAQQYLPLWTGCKAALEVNFKSIVYVQRKCLRKLL